MANMVQGVIREGAFSSDPDTEAVYPTEGKPYHRAVVAECSVTDKRHVYAELTEGPIALLTFGDTTAAACGYGKSHSQDAVWRQFVMRQFKLAPPMTIASDWEI